MWMSTESCGLVASDVLYVRMQSSACLKLVVPKLQGCTLIWEQKIIMTKVAWRGAFMSGCWRSWMNSCCVDWSLAINGLCCARLLFFCRLRLCSTWRWGQKESTVTWTNGTATLDYQCECLVLLRWTIYLHGVSWAVISFTVSNSDRNGLFVGSSEQVWRTWLLFHFPSQLAFEWVWDL